MTRAWVSDPPLDTVPDSDAATPDLWLALVAGHSVWADGQYRPGPRERVASAFATGAAAACAAMAWAGMRLRNGNWPWQVETDDQAVLSLAAIAVVVVAAVIAVYNCRIAFGRAIVPAAFWPSVLWRGTCFAVLVVGLAVCFPRGQIGAGVMIGLLAGADLALSLWALGTAPQLAALVRQFLLSPVHLGAVGAVLAVLLTGAGPSAGTLVALYGAVLVALAAGLTEMKVLDSLALHFEAQYELHRIDVAARERAHRAHWLHDDVLSEVRLASLRITNGSASPEQINAELVDLDHRLRLRQLDEMIRDGTPPLYEVLQPHLRRAQSLGVRLERVPTHEVTGIALSEPEAKLLNRVLSLLTSNAINAGATALSVDVRLPPGAIEVGVTDDAGGFDLAEVPAGRGLHRLSSELAPGSLRRADAPGGSTVTVLVPRSGDGARGITVAPADHRVPRPAGRAMA
ncbi:MAG TPA: hypothetical protein VNQ73_05590 [Ilumatobacter sp.]|nr:hypothetical protein [Ilumatobacter sp.]